MVSRVRTRFIYLLLFFFAQVQSKTTKLINVTRALLTYLKIWAYICPKGYFGGIIFGEGLIIGGSFALQNGFGLTIRPVQTSALAPELVLVLVPGRGAQICAWASTKGQVWTGPGALK